MNMLSLFGLINVFDGLAAAEDRSLFATASHLKRSAPHSPGLMDIWIEFQNATEALFIDFFP